MQGLADFIETDVKAAYINQLLRVGFDTIDFGSFVSPKAIPQMRDTAEVLAKLDLSGTSTKLLAIVANERGAQEACQYPEIQYLGYPFSISETFQLRNTNATIAESVERTKAIQELCVQHGKQLVLYISMGFGNPYGDPWSAEVALHWTNRLVEELGVRIISLSDTVGVAEPADIEAMFTALIPVLPHVEFGAHLHARKDNWQPKTDAAWRAGCRRFDHAIAGYGGCPMAEDDLVGNLTTELFVEELERQGSSTVLDLDQLARCVRMAGEVFPG